MGYVYEHFEMFLCCFSAEEATSFSSARTGLFMKKWESYWELLWLQCCCSVSLGVFPCDTGFPCKTKTWRKVLCSQGLAEKGHSQQKGGNFAMGHDLDLIHILAYRCIWQCSNLFLHSAKTHHGGAQCAAEECETPLLGWASLFLPDHRQVILRLGFHQWWRSELFQFCEYVITQKWLTKSWALLK